MWKRRRPVDSAVSPTETPVLDTVFIDTSLGTHFVMVASSTETVSDFKKRIAVEHKRCYPETGEITIHSLKVKRGENFYHLLDVLFLYSVFHRVEGDKFIAVDCSSTPADNLNQRSSDHGEMSAICPVDGVPTPVLPLVDVEKSSKKVIKFKGNSSLPENSTESHEKKKKKKRNSTDSHEKKKRNSTVSHEKKKKKRKLNHCEDVSRRSNVEVVVNASHESPVERTDYGNIMVNAVKAREIEIGYEQQESLINKFSEVAVVMNDHSSNGVLFDEKTDRKEVESVFPNDSVAGQSQDKYGSSIPTDLLEGVHIDEPILSAKLVENTGMRQCMKSDGNKKGKKAKKTPVKIQDSSDLKVENRKAEGVEGSYIAGAAEKSEVGVIVDSPVLLHCERTSEAVLKNVIDEDDMSIKYGNELVPNDQADHLDLVEINNSVTLDDANVDGNRKREKAQADQDASTLEQEAATCESLEGTLDPATAEKCIEKSQKLLISDGRKPEPVNQKFEDELGKDARNDHSRGNRESTISARVMDTSAGMQEGKSVIKKMNKSKKKDVACATATVEKSVENFQLMFSSDERNEDTMLWSEKPEFVTQKSENEPGRDAPVEQDNIIGSNLPASVLDTGDKMENAKSNGRKRKKSKKKGGKIQDASDAEDETRKSGFVEPCPEACNTKQKEDGSHPTLGPNIEGGRAPATTEKNIESFQMILASDGRKEDTVLETENPESFTRKSENDLDNIVPTEHSEGIRESTISARVMDTSAGMQVRKSAVKKRKKSKKGGKIQDALDAVDVTRKSGFVEPCPEACNTEQKEVGSHPTLGPNIEVMRAPATTEKNIDNFQMMLASDGRKEDSVLESENPESYTRKSEIDLDNIVPTEHSEGIRESFPSAGVVDIPNRIQDAKSVGKKKRKKSKKKGPRIQDASCVEDKTKGKSNEPCAVACTTKEKEDGSRPSLGQNKEVVLPSYSKTSDCIDAELLQKATESLPNLPANNVVGVENIVDSIRKRKKGEDTDVSVVKSSMEKISGEMPLTEQYLTSSVHIGRQQAHDSSSQVTPDNMEEKVDTEHGPTAQEINFRQYFVHDQNQQKGTSSDNVKVSSKSNGEMKTGKNVKESSFSSTNTEMKTPRAVIGKLGTMKQDSHHVNSINNKMMSVKPQQNKSILAKSGAKYLDNGGGNSIKKISMKTPNKNSMLKKSGSIFQGNSDDDSGDETGAVHPDASTRAPSDGSSQSVDSEGESELSERSHDGKGRSAGGVESTLDPDDFSIKMIVRSSNQFKKAKLQASQSEPELDESLLDTQPYP